MIVVRVQVQYTTEALAFHHDTIPVEKIFTSQERRPLAAMLSARPKLTQRILSPMAQRILILTQHFGGNRMSWGSLFLQVHTLQVTEVVKHAGSAVGLLDFSRFTVQQGSIKLILLSKSAQLKSARLHFIEGPYAAPEVQPDSEATDVADAFSAGVILYVMVTGSIPHKGTGRSQNQCFTWSACL